MATFVSLKRDNSGDIVFVNMDKIISMERNQAKYTILTPDENRAAITVSETPDQIMDVMRSERKKPNSQTIGADLPTD